MKILIIEDDKNISSLLSFNLKKEGFDTIATVSGNEGIKLARSNKPSLIILDLMLPDIGGLDVCKVLKGRTDTKNIPIIMLTAKSEEIDRVVGLEVGADDYVTKPFSVRELILRVKAVLKRYSKPSKNGEDEIKFKDLLVDISKHTVKLGSKKLELTLNEFKLLVFLLNSKEKVVSREALLNSVWGYDADVFTRTVDTCVARLREKLGAYGRYMLSVRGVGYKWSDK